ncbi:MAG: cytochrome c biogenesis protein CcsA [Candidatus Hydrogenedentes bacterium]|nr:cytochrome c biogenesis protein CcsA [Candidatus Hydrogenedentota bacterium]
MKQWVLVAWIAAGIATGSALGQQRSPVQAPPQWDQETLRLAAALPIQDSGRVKPLDTYAQFTLLRFNGMRALRLPGGERLTPIAWLLNCLFYPETAKTYAHFIVDNSEAVSAAGIVAHENKRDRYSYNELLPGRERLFELARQYTQIEDKKRTPIEQQVLNLANNVFEFEQLIHFFDFAEARFRAPAGTALAQALPEAEGVSYSEALRRAPDVLLTLRSQNAALSAEVLEREVQALSTLMGEMDQAAVFAQGLALLPPRDAAVKEWRSPADMLAVAFDVSKPREETVGLVAFLEELHRLRDDRPAFRAQLAAFHEQVKQVAEARGEYQKIPIEVFFYRGKFFFYSQWLFVLSFLLIALSWLAPRRKWLDRTVLATVALPTVLLVIGISLRCIIRERPPVSTLYETILFITAVAVLMALLMEFVNRQRIAVAVGSVLGTLGMFIAYRYELKEGVDTMPSLVAVLDTNFWLSTHVTTVTTGYAAGMLSGAIAHVYILGKLFHFRKGDITFYRTLARMCYGVLCFGLLFATVGTILGGIWANYSWGRFWGWDPKENGALMIVLWNLVILHARMGRYIADLGTAMCAVVLAMIVAFSWWGVNLLGVGLHSYGFTSGIMNMLMIYWIAECAVIALGLCVYWRERTPRNAQQTPSRRAGPAVSS